MPYNRDTSFGLCPKHPVFSLNRKNSEISSKQNWEPTISTVMLNEKEKLDALARLGIDLNQIHDLDILMQALQYPCYLYH